VRRPRCRRLSAHAVLFHRKPRTDPLRMWAKKLIDKKPFKLVAVALANKMARIDFATQRGRWFIGIFRRKARRYSSQPGSPRAQAAQESRVTKR
jgi:hypothetical protein